MTTGKWVRWSAEYWVVGWVEQSVDRWEKMSVEWKAERLVFLLVVN
jgi:hypothetical protein